MPERWKRCVREVKAKQDDVNPYAVCTASTGQHAEKHGKKKKKAVKKIDKAWKEYSSDPAHVLGIPQEEIDEMSAEEYATAMDRAVPPLAEEKPKKKDAMNSHEPMKKITDEETAEQADYDYEYKRRSQEAKDAYYPAKKKKKLMNKTERGQKQDAVFAADILGADVGDVKRAMKKPKKNKLGPVEEEEIRSVEDMKNYPSDEQEENWRELADYENEAVEEHDDVEKANERVIRNEDGEPIGTEKYDSNYSDNDDDPYAREPPLTPEQIEEENRRADAAWERRKARKMQPDMLHDQQMKEVTASIPATPNMEKAWGKFKSKTKYPDIEVRYIQDKPKALPEMCDQCKANQSKGKSPMCFRCKLNKAWMEFVKDIEKRDINPNAEAMANALDAMHTAMSKPKQKKKLTEPSDWEEASLDEERHQDELNEMQGMNEEAYDEAGAYEHEMDYVSDTEPNYDAMDKPLKEYKKADNIEKTWEEFTKTRYLAKKPKYRSAHQESCANCGQPQQKESEKDSKCWNCGNTPYSRVDVAAEDAKWKKYLAEHPEVGERAKHLRKSYEDFIAAKKKVDQAMREKNTQDGGAPMKESIPQEKTKNETFELMDENGMQRLFFYDYDEKKLWELSVNGAGRRELPIEEAKIILEEKDKINPNNPEQLKRLERPLNSTIKEKHHTHAGTGGVETEDKVRTRELKEKMRAEKLKAEDEQRRLASLKNVQLRLAAEAEKDKHPLMRDSAPNFAGQKGRKMIPPYEAMMGKAWQEFAKKEWMPYKQWKAEQDKKKSPDKDKKEKADKKDKR